MLSLAFILAKSLYHLFYFFSNRNVQTIDRQSKIDPLDTSGEQPSSILGDLEFRNVHFSYPSRPEVPILRGLSLSIPRGKTVALVGESGCGKSTIIALLEKFYVAEQGEVLVDGKDVRELNTRWLRGQVNFLLFTFLCLFLLFI